MVFLTFVFQFLYYTCSEWTIERHHFEAKYRESLKAIDDDLVIFLERLDGLAYGVVKWTVYVVVRVSLGGSHHGVLSLLRACCCDLEVRGSWFKTLVQICTNVLSRILLTRHWFLRALKQRGANVRAVACERPRNPPTPLAVYIADTPIELLESVLRCLSIALGLVFQFANPSSLLPVLRAPLGAL